MIYECLIVPTETPTPLLEIKRALLTYDKIKLIDPNDRDVIPPSTYTNIITGAPIGLLGVNGGPIRPMSKSIGYDEIFEKTIDQCKPAINQGLIEVIQTYAPKPANVIYILSDVTGGYPLDVDQVFFMYREIASKQDFLNAAIAYTKGAIIDERQNHYDLIIKGLGDYPIPNLKFPELPKLVLESSIPEDTINFLTAIARARIAATIKYSGYCDHKNLIPIFSRDVYGEIILKIFQNMKSFFSDATGDNFWVKQNRILELCHEEYIDDSILNEMSLAEVIKLRTSAWGKQATAREELFNSIREIAANEDIENIFKKKSTRTISEYTKDSENLLQERKKINFKIKCEIGKATLGIPSAVGAIYSQIGSPSASIGLALAAGGIWCFDKAMEYIPTLREITTKEKVEKRGAGFAISKFYSKIDNLKN
jgi:hypothetical protein